jgi:hypothetical protein
MISVTFESEGKFSFLLQVDVVAGDGSTFYNNQYQNEYQMGVAM